MKGGGLFVGGRIFWGGQRGDQIFIQWVKGRGPEFFEGQRGGARIIVPLVLFPLHHSSIFLRFNIVHAVHHNNSMIIFLSTLVHLQFNSCTYIKLGAQSQNLLGPTFIGYIV